MPPYRQQKREEIFLLCMNTYYKMKIIVSVGGFKKG